MADGETKFDADRKLELKDGPERTLDQKRKSG